MLRVFFLHHRELLGRLCRAGWEVVRELMATAAGDPSFRPGMVSVVQTHGDMLGWHPHVHAIATRGGWVSEGGFVPMPFVSTTAAERRRLRTRTGPRGPAGRSPAPLAPTSKRSAASRSSPDAGIPAFKGP